MNVEALDLVLAALPDRPAVSVALARTLAGELDRQAAAGEGVNAALVREYATVLGALTSDEEEADPVGDLLREIFDAGDAVEAEPARKG